MGKKKAPPVTSTGHRKEFIDLLNANARRHDLWRVFSDFVEMAAIAISNSMDIYRRADRETRYMEIVKAYDAEELRRFAEALAALTMALELSEFDDMLGSVFMELGLGNKWHGQFFTPYHLCHMMGMMTLGDKDPRAAIAGKGYVVVNDPCIGGGAMIIGLAHAMKDSDINFQQCMYAVCQDVDTKALPVYMHTFPDGRSVQANLYPDTYLAEFRKLMQQEWLPQRSSKYFGDRDPKALPVLDKVIMALPGPKAAANDRQVVPVRRKRRKQ